jgi:two-component system, NarL family, nitrate/nitrite response regulator NarL
MSKPGRRGNGRALTRVLIADEQPIYRSGLAHEIRQRPGLELVAEAGDGAAAVKLAREHAPDVAVLELRMPRLDGVGAVQALRTAGCVTRVLILSASRRRESLYDALTAGANGYLTKDAAGSEVCDAIQTIGSGRNVIDRSMQDALLTELQLRQGSSSHALSPRELEVLTLTAEGLTSVEIGARLFIGSSTVKTHLQRVYGKLGVADRAAMVAEAMRRGIIE